MENLSNDKDIQSLDYLPNEDDPNNFGQNDNFNDNENLNMDNQNIMNFENYNFEGNDNIDLDKNNLDIENTQAAFVQTLNLQIKQQII